MDTIEAQVRAGASGVVLRASDYVFALKKVAAAARAAGKKVFVWDACGGIQEILPEQEITCYPYAERAKETPPVNALRAALEKENAVIVLVDYHSYLNSPAVVSAVRSALVQSVSKGITLLFLSRTFAVPPDLEREMAVLDCGLPGREDLEPVLREVCRVAKYEPAEEEIKDAVDAALGLTLKEAEDAFAVELVKNRKLSPAGVFAQKRQIVERAGALDFVEGVSSLESVGGMDRLKAWFAKRLLTFSPEALSYGLRPARGCLLLGVPGTGKSLTAKAVAGEWRKPLLRLDVGKVFGSYVGESESNLRRVLKTVEAVAPCVVWLDEVEKGFSGVASSGRTDSGVAARVFGTFLTWMQEKTCPAFVVATANDVSALPPEFLRRGRFDEIFFIDLPDKKEREQILSIHLTKRNRDPKKYPLGELSFSLEGYSGAEIEALVEEALLRAFSAGRELTPEDLKEAKAEVVPLSVIRKGEIERLREWARTYGLKPARSETVTKHERRIVA